ncbi:hypothetical protein GCM10023079_06400 [Streptomyces chitinivorans]
MFPEPRAVRDAFSFLPHSMPVVATTAASGEGHGFDVAIRRTRGAGWRTRGTCCGPGSGDRAAADRDPTLTGGVAELGARRI